MPKAKRQENWDDLEVFTSKGAKIKDAKITIVETSSILFNAGFCHKASVADKSHVIISYSPQNRSMCFQFTSDSKANGVLKLVQRSGGAQVGSRSLFNYFFLDPKKLAGRYEPKQGKLPKIGDTWIINLDNKLPE
jgi:hypothetical protein